MADVKFYYARKEHDILEPIVNELVEGTQNEMTLHGDFIKVVLEGLSDERAREIYGLLHSRGIHTDEDPPQMLS